MMKKTLLTICALSLLWVGCAKKQVVKQPGEGAGAQGEEARKEPTIRFNDWQNTPELQTIYFAYDSSELSEETRAQLKKNASYIEAHPEFNVLVEGYCDERGTIEYNLALGQRRATSVREYYGRIGVAVARIGTISYGEENPANPGHDETAWSQNRRVVTKVRNVSESKK